MPRASHCIACCGRCVREATLKGLVIDVVCVLVEFVKIMFGQMSKPGPKVRSVSAWCLKKQAPTIFCIRSPYEGEGCNV